MYSTGECQLYPYVFREESVAMCMGDQYTTRERRSFYDHVRDVNTVDILVRLC